MTDFSGKFLLRTGEELHKKLSLLSAKNNKSLNATCLELIELGIKQMPNKESPIWLDEIKKHFDLLGVVLFGSRARNEAFKDSDTDLLLVINDTPNRSHYKKWEKVASNLPSNVSPHFVNTKGTGSLWLEVALDAKIIWEKDNIVSSILQNLRYEIAHGDVERRLSHGHPYWIRHA